jgi:hypothetical protein
MNRRFIARAALTVAALGIFGISQSSSAALIDYQGNIDGRQEGTTSLGTGHAQVTYDDVAHTMRVQATFSGLTGDTTAAHIHAPTPAPFSGTAGVATMQPSFAGFPLGVKAGVMDNTFDLTQSASWNSSYITANGGTPASAEAAFFSSMNAGRAYFNIHSTTNSGGEIRGYLPEPGALTFLGAAAMTAIIRRRRAV